MPLYQRSVTTARAGADRLSRAHAARSVLRPSFRHGYGLSRVSTSGREFSSILLSRIVDEVVSDLEIPIQSVDGQVETGELATIHADALQMRLLFQNLISNAVKFHRPGMPPRVRIWGTPALADGRAVAEIRVEDNGIGLDPQDTERIFQPFQRLHGKEAYDGSGLGLAICQKIVERHHGAITVESPPGRGSTFIIRLPSIL